MPLRSIDWEKGEIRIINQNKLPQQLAYEKLTSLEEVAEAVRSMKVRGAPLIGVAAALGLALVAHQANFLPKAETIKRVEAAAEVLKATRPTAKNLSWALERVLSKIRESESPSEMVVEEALAMMEEDIETNRKMASNGLGLIEDGDTILTHCNTGSLATVSLGTALGVILRAYQEGVKVRVFATETRPRMQGSKLTMFELHYEGVDTTLIPDTAVGHVIGQGHVTKVLVGADRILTDGTTYNKIGTYQVAVLARRHRVPFYVVAPASTFDLKSRREEITIEERSSSEVTHIGGVKVAPEGVKVYNPAFDETPPQLISAFVTDRGVFHPPFYKSIKRALSST